MYIYIYILPRLFTNVLDVNNIELLNANPEVIDDLWDMLVPGLKELIVVYFQGLCVSFGQASHEGEMMS